MRLAARYALRGRRRRPTAAELGLKAESQSDLEDAFAGLWRMLAPKAAPKPRRGYRFDDVRKWAFDFAWPAQLVAVEIEGGVWTQGRHTRGAGFVEDCRKYSAATCKGWAILRYTEADLTQRGSQVIGDVVGLLEARG